MRAQAERLLADPRAKRVYWSFYRQWLNLDRVTREEKAVRTAEVDASWSTQSQASTLEDARLLVENVAHEGGALSDQLTCNPALQRTGVVCTGGARSLDQELGLPTGAPGRFGSRVYGYEYGPNAAPTPFSFLGPGQAAPIVLSLAAAFQDLLGYYKPPTTDGGAPTREERVAQLRPSVLDLAAREYDALAPQLSREGRERLANHQQLIRDLEQSLGNTSVANCDATANLSGHAVTQFMRLVHMAFACDLTRVATFIAPVPESPEFGYPADTAVHPSFAHASVPGATSCRQAYSPIAERAMTDLSTWYAGHFATLLRELDSVIEGSGTLLDRTVVVWVSELATPTHEHHIALRCSRAGKHSSTRGATSATRKRWEVRSPICRAQARLSAASM